MQNFDKENWKQNVQKEFDEIEKFNNQFYQTFSNRMQAICEKYHPIHSFDGNFNEFLSVYSSHLLYIVESVIEKDKTYSQNRLKIELERMNEVVSKITKPSAYPNLDEELNTSIKKMVVEYFPSIFELTGDGFRLLEANLTLIIRYFHNDFDFGTKKILIV